MLINVRPKNVQKFGNNPVAEYNKYNDVLNFSLNISRFINDDYTLRYPEVDVPKETTAVIFYDPNGGVKIKVTKDEFLNTFNKELEQYDIPYKEWVKTKNIY